MGFVCYLCLFVVLVEGFFGVWMFVEGEIICEFVVVLL